MTYKSIDSILAEHLRGARLRRFVPLFDPHETERRELWMLPALHQWLYQGDRKATLEFKPKIRGFLARYVKGDPIDNLDYMKSWKWDVFELRAQLLPKRENTRIFGAFVKADIFIATHQRLRSDFGDSGDPAWDKALRRALDEFETLFPGYHPIPSRPFVNCVTERGYDHG